MHKCPNNAYIFLIRIPSRVDIDLSVRLSSSLYIHLSVCLSACLSACLDIRLSARELSWQPKQTTHIFGCCHTQFTGYAKRSSYFCPSAVQCRKLLHIMLEREPDNASKRGRERRERERERFWTWRGKSSVLGTVKPRSRVQLVICCHNNTRNPSCNFQNFIPLSPIRLSTRFTLPSITFSVICLLHFASCCCCCEVLQCWWWVDLILHVEIIDSSFCAAGKAGKRA